MRLILERKTDICLVAAALIFALSSSSGLARGCGFSLISSDASRIVLKFELPDWELEPLEAEGAEFQLIRTTCGEDLLKGGFPILPQFKALIAVPPGSEASIRWNPENALRLQNIRLLPAQPAPREGEDEPDRPFTVTAYSSDLSRQASYPEEKILLLGPKRFRDLMVCEILVRPFSYEPSSGTLTVTETFLATIDIRSSALLTRGRAAPGAKTYEEVYRGVLLNYDSSLNWRIPPAEGPELAASPFSQGERWMSLRIKNSGLYAVSSANLVQAGVDPTTLDPSTFRLYSGGGRMLNEDPGAPGPVLSEVAIHITGSQDGSFDPQDRLIFYGESLDRFTVSDTGALTSIRHRYDNYAVYWLTWGGGAVSGLRMAESRIPLQPGAVTATAAEIWYHWEENTRYLALENEATLQTLNPAPDYWAWVLEGDNSGFIERSFDLEKETAGEGNFLRYEIYGTLGNQLETYSISLNDVQIFNGSNFSINAVTSGWISLPEGILHQESNLFTLRGEGLVLGFFELRSNTALSLGQGEQLIFHQLNAPSAPAYELSSVDAGQVEIFDITVPTHPVRLWTQSSAEGKILFAAPAVGAPVRSFAAVSGSAYKEPETVRLERLPDLRNMSGAEYLVLTSRELAQQAEKLAALRSAGYITAMVAVEDVYNEFSLGQADPAAIRNFLQHAFTAWRIRPQFVAFFGDGHNDFRGVTAVGRSKPNHILPYITKEDLAIEEWYVRFAGSDLPQISFGRIPVQDKVQAETVVEKILKYEGGANAGDWSRRLILVADDGYGLGGTCDYVTNHVPGSEELDSLFPADIERRKIYLDEYPFDPPGIGTRKPAANEALLNWWNRGVLVINYLGHGSKIHWAQERVFDVERDLPMLTNEFRLPLVLNSSCSIGYFDDYNEQAMAERLLSLKGGGAVAVFAGTRITYAFQNLALNKLLVQYLFSDSRKPVGLAALQARLNLGGLDRGNAQRYLVFGDPALGVHTPGRKIRLQLESPGELKAGQKINFIGRIEDQSGNQDAAFSGVSQIKFLGTGQPAKVSYQCLGLTGPRERTVSFVRTPAVLFNGPVTVSGGTLSGAFILPLNLAGSLPADTLSVQTGSFIGYATSDITDASGASEKVVISRTAYTVTDTTSPKFSFFSHGKALADGDRLSKTWPLELVVRDESGINTTGSPGMQLTVEVDEGLTYTADLTPLFRYQTDSYQEGTVAVDLSKVGEGLHSFRFRATDNALNTGRAELMLFVEAQRSELNLTNVLNYPNPFQEETEICFEISAPADVKIRIFTVAGRPVREIQRYSLPAGFNTIHWDGSDEYQQKLANGVYLYKIICRATASGSFTGTQEVEAIGKALLSR
ncbi:MAG TPA: type IX secretion system sortase PorU [archaeon]|nr:type IX secretion system sortase PorU [archaeon]